MGRALQLVMRSVGGPGIWCATLVSSESLGGTTIGWVIGLAAAAGAAAGADAGFAASDASAAPAPLARRRGRSLPAPRPRPHSQVQLLRTAPLAPSAAAGGGAFSKSLSVSTSTGVRFGAGRRAPDLGRLLVLLGGQRSTGVDVHFARSHRRQHAALVVKMTFGPSSVQAPLVSTVRRREHQPIGRWAAPAAARTTPHRDRCSAAASIRRRWSRHALRVHRCHLRAFALSALLVERCALSIALRPAFEPTIDKRNGAAEKSPGRAVRATPSSVALPRGSRPEPQYSFQFFSTRQIGIGAMRSTRVSAAMVLMSTR